MYVCQGVYERVCVWMGVRVDLHEGAEFQEEPSPGSRGLKLRPNRRPRRLSHA